jgi:hypothetical protein
MTTSAERNKDGLSITNGVSDRRRASPALNISVDVGAGESSLDTDRHIATQDTNVTSTRGSIESSSETTNSTSRPKNNVDGPIGSIGALHMVDAPRSDIAIHETQGAEAHSTRLQTPISASAPDEVERTKSTVATNDSRDRVSRDGSRNVSSTDWSRPGPKNDSGSQHLPMTHTASDGPMVPRNSPQSRSPAPRHKLLLRRFKDRSRAWSLRVIDRILPPESSERDS